ncbi:uncharacterized protein LOC131413759 isoform X2 [Diceros bicornis minor]|uniref:uncharacterized protein LOC131413759 isoform X2 n=1 Tax=Diceros bicornis minor TaxID=77932 RepID=UPI0026F2DA0A|nr:uncharacterized protein LOC131413759 isoform X2 [Diceros bicornis minor]
MAASRYRRFLKLCEEWPVDETKRGRDLGAYLRQRVAQAFREGENTQCCALTKLIPKDLCGAPLSPSVLPEPVYAGAAGLGSPRPPLCVSRRPAFSLASRLVLQQPWDSCIHVVPIY